MNINQLDQNQKLLIQAFKLQNQEAYDEALEQNQQLLRKLQIAGDTLIKIIQKMQSNSQFYTRHMQLMKQERQLISQRDYKEFLSKNQKVLSKNFQKNAYLALLMQQMQQKQPNKQQKQEDNKKNKQQKIYTEQIRGKTKQQIRKA